MRASVSALLAGVALATSAPLSAATALVSVAGNNNPFLAGLPNGAVCCGGDDAPNESPTLFTGFAPGSVLSFSATGFTNGAGFGDIGAEGVANFNMVNYNTGIAPALGVGVNALLGVFLTDAAPTLGSQPAALNFNGNRTFATLAPGIAQIFYIGDGLTGSGSGSGSVQQFTAPTGATRLFLGVADGSGWFNNNGTLAVTVTFEAAPSSVVPEPTTWAMMILGFGLVGAALRRRPAVSRVNA